MIESIFRGGWSTVSSVITYQKLMLSEGDAGTLDPATGVWTTNVAGLYDFKACFSLRKEHTEVWCFQFKISVEILSKKVIANLLGTAQGSTKSPGVFATG